MKVLGENFLKKSAVSDYNQLLKTFFLEQFMKDEKILEVHIYTLYTPYTLYILHAER